MMRTKDVEIKGKNYQITLMNPVVGSRIMSNLFASMAGVETKEGGDVEAKATFENLSPEEKADISIQSMWFMAANTLPTAKYEEIQKEALRCCRMYQGNDTNSPPIPMMMANGKWAVDELPVEVVSQLILKSLQFNVAPFFTESALS